MANIIDNIINHADIFNNLARSLGPVQGLIEKAAFIIGLAFAFKAIYTLKVYGESRAMTASHTSFKEPMMYLLIAIILIYFPTGLNLMMATTFGESGILQYGSYTGPNQVLQSLFGTSSPVGWALTILIQTIGLIAFVHGWILVARASSQGQPPGGTGKGLMHVFGGVLAMNVVKTLEIINNTFYGT